MHEQDLKSLLENIYHLLAEDNWYNDPPPPPPKPVYGPSYDLPKPLVKNPQDMELLYGPNWNDTRAPLNPPRNIKPEEYIDWVIRNIQQHNNTPFTQEEIERYFTDSVKPKNIHSTLIENIRNILMEGPPGWTAEHPEGWDPTEWMYDPLKPYIPPRPEGWVGPWPFEGWEDIIPPLSRPEWDGRIPIHNPIYWDADDTPPTQEEIERYFTDSVKLKNIHSTLIEEAPDGDGATITGAEKYTPSQAPGPRPTTFYDPYAQPPTLFPLGPWDGQWLPGFAALWPPPTSTLPPTGPGGMWVSYTNPGSTQVFYFYVYPGVNGMFPVWHWGEGTNGNFVFTELPPWGLPT